MEKAARLRAAVHALGDAWVKAGNPAKGRLAWREGVRQFPDAKELRQRLELKSDSALAEFVAGARSLEKPVDIVLSFLDISSRSPRL